MVSHGLIHIASGIASGAARRYAACSRSCCGGSGARPPRSALLAVGTCSRDAPARDFAGARALRPRPRPGMEEAGPGPAGRARTPPTQAAEQLSRTASTDSLCSNASTLSRLGPPPPQPPPKPPPPQRLPPPTAARNTAAAAPPTVAGVPATANPTGSAGTPDQPVQHPSAALHQAVGAPPQQAAAPAAFTDARAPPASAEQQIAADAAFARQLQQQLAIAQQADAQRAAARDEALARQLQEQLEWEDRAQARAGPAPSRVARGHEQDQVEESGHERRLTFFRSLVARQTVTT